MMNRSETLDKAKACVCGQRENEYGSPEDNFAAIAGFWSVYKGVEFTANDVAMMMALLRTTAMSIWLDMLPVVPKSTLKTEKENNKP